MEKALDLGDGLAVALRIRDNDKNPHPSASGGHPLPKGEGNNVGVPPSLGLPVGLQIIGPQWGEQKIFNVGYAYQQATDWHKKHPEVSSGQ